MVALLLILFKSKLVHPVEEERTLFRGALLVATDAWENLSSRKDNAGVGRAFLRALEVGLDAVATKLDALDQPGIKQPLHDP